MEEKVLLSSTADDAASTVDLPRSEPAWHAMGLDAALKHWRTDPRRGLTQEEARLRSARFGLNRLKEAKRASPLQQFLSQFTDFIVLVLIGAAIVSGIVGEWQDSIAILVIVVLNAILGFIQEYRAERAIEALRKLTAPTARVLRDGEVKNIPAQDVVPGDILVLEMGDLVPADGRLIETYSFKADEASLTGESVSVMKDAHKVVEEDSPLGDRRNMVYASTTITYGKGRGVVTATGMATQLGRIAGLVQEIEEGPTPLQQRLERMGKWLVYACLAIVTVVFALGVLRGDPVMEMFLVAVSLAVAAIPEGLPAVVTIALALGVRRMVKRNALIRRLPSVETLGSASVICTDKTGTLTENQMTVRYICVGEHLIEVTGEGYAPAGWFRIGPRRIDETDDELQLVLRIGALCNNAQLKNDGDGKGNWTIVGDPTEAALLTAAAKAGLWREELEKEYHFVGEIPFDSGRKRMTSLWRNTDGQLRGYIKGAPDVILDLCTHHYDDGQIKELGQQKRQEILGVNNHLAAKAMRLLAMAYRDLDGLEKEPAAEAVERDLTYVGLVAMIDPPRPEAKSAVKECQRAGIQVVMVTGDHQSTATAIAKGLDILREGEFTLRGRDLERVSDQRLAEIVDKIKVYARVSPEHKLRIVRAWRTNGAVAAMTGDGVNDAPALKEADIGIAMGITGTDVSRESADMVLADDNFASIVAAVEEGRGIFDNIRRFIHYLLSCNTGEILTLFIASLAGMPLPLLPIQILWINLATDSLPALALGVEPTEPGIMDRPPRPVKENIITRSMAYTMGLQGVIIGALTLGAFILEYYFLGGGVQRARVMAFSTSIFAQNVHAFNLRSNKYSLFQVGVFSNIWLVVAFLIVILSEIAIIYVPFFHPIFETMPLLLRDWGIVVGLGFMPLLIMEIIKLVRNRMA